MNCCPTLWLALSSKRWQMASDMSIGREGAQLTLSSMMALDTRGPMNEDVLPTIEKREKKRNSLPLGVTSEII